MANDNFLPLLNLKREPYDKPKLGTIDLSPEQVLSAGCKTAPSNTISEPTCLGMGLTCYSVKGS